jgi:putative two-component system response regulator
MIKGNVLVVDDEDILRETMVEILSMGGFHAVGMPGGDAALKELEKRHYDLLISDVMMPKMNGMELVTRVHEKRPGLETIVVSGHGTEATKDKLDMMGVYGYLEKPIRAADLIAISEKAVKSNRLQRIGCEKKGPYLLFSRERILIADDDATMLDVLHDGLSLQGYNVTSVHNGEQAYEMFLINDYDMIILDINMPGLSGIETVTTIRENDPFTYVLLISGEAVKPEIQEALDCGANKFLAKPFQISKLIDLVNKIDFEKIKERKKMQSDKGKEDAGRRFGGFLRIISPYFWMRLVQRNAIELVGIVLVSLIIGALSAYLCEQKAAGNDKEETFMGKAGAVEKYLSRDDVRELRKR